MTLDFELKAIKSTANVPVPDKLIDQVIGQDKAVQIIKKAAKQKRNILLVGEPGTGKSMLAQAMAELMPQEQLEDVLIYPNEQDENMPKVRVTMTYPDANSLSSDEELQEIYKQKAAAEQHMQAQNESLKKKGFFVDPAKQKGGIGCGRLLVDYYKKKRGQQFQEQFQEQFQPQAAHKKSQMPPMLIGIIVLAVALIIIATINQNGGFGELVDDIKLTDLIIVGIAIMSFFFTIGLFAMFYSMISGMMRRPMIGVEITIPKLIVDNSGRLTAPFIDGTGAKAGALLGDVKHDPLQSGGLGTPAHLRVEAGSIHKANKGVLFIDEISSLKLESQQALLTAMQEKRYSITGQSELSSGALVKTEPVPCDFVLVAAGNYEALGHMHPALRSRIRGSGYEIYVNDKMDDNEENVKKIVRFVAQEVKKDGKIPHFDRQAIDMIIHEARKMAGQKAKLTLRLRELGGLIRASGDIANELGAQMVTSVHVEKAKQIATTLEAQLAKKYTELRKEYSVFLNQGEAIGKVNGLAVLGGSAGIVTPIVADVTPAGSRNEGKIIATGKLGEIAREAVQNVSAIVKKHLGKNTADYDIHIQFLQTYDGVEGDSASISTAVAVISALEGVQINQEFAMTGSLSVRGEVLPVGGVTQKTEAAIEAGLKHVIVPLANLKDILLDEDKKNRIQIHTAKTIVDVLEMVLKDSNAKKKLIKQIEIDMK